MNAVMWAAVPGSPITSGPLCLWITFQYEMWIRPREGVLGPPKAKSDALSGHRH
jgi:hypothetical protein